MMKASLLLLLFVLAAGPVFGQAHIIKQRAKELNEQNNARQGITPTAPSAPARTGAAVPPAAPPSPMIASPEVLRAYDVNNLKTDVAGMGPAAAVGAEQTAQLARNLATASRGAAKPSAKAIEQLSQSLSAALRQARLDKSKQAQLVEDVVGILNSGGTTATDRQAKITSVQATLQRGGVERKLAVAVANDLTNVAGEIQKGSAPR